MPIVTYIGIDNHHKKKMIVLVYPFVVIDEKFIEEEFVRAIPPGAPVSLTLKHCRSTCRDLRVLLTILNERVLLCSLYYAFVQPLLRHESQTDLDDVFNELFAKDEFVQYHESLSVLHLGGFKRLALTGRTLPNLDALTIENSAVPEPLTLTRSVKYLTMIRLTEAVGTMRYLTPLPKLRAVYFESVDLSNVTTEDLRPFTLRRTEVVKFTDCDLQLPQIELIFNTVGASPAISSFTLLQDEMPRGYGQHVINCLRRNEGLRVLITQAWGKEDSNLLKLSIGRRTLWTGFVERVLQKVFSCEDLAHRTYSYLRPHNSK